MEGLLYIPEEVHFPPYDWEQEDYLLNALLAAMTEPVDLTQTDGGCWYWTRPGLQGPPVTPMVYKYPDPVVIPSSHCCFSGCDPLPCGCCKRARTWCPHSVAPYGKPGQ